MLTRDELEVVAQLCLEHDLIAVTDEVYEHLTYDGTRHIPLATLPGMRDRTVSISSAGKSFSVTGWKIGWICAPAALVSAVNTVKQFLTYTHSAPMQLAVAYALDDETDWVAQSCALAAVSPGPARGRAARASGFEVQSAAGHVLRLRPTSGRSALTTASSSPGRCPTTQASWRIPDRGVLRHPGVGTPFVRFAFCKRDDVLDDAVARLRQWSHAGVGPAS